MTAQPATKVSVSSTTAHLSWWLFPSGFRFWQSDYWVGVTNRIVSYEKK
jgi:hypothetical protein